MSSDNERYHLYRILVPDGRSYIGASKKPRVRFSAHCSARSRIGEAIRHPGRKACRMEILCVGSRDYIFDLEPRAIIAFRTRWPAGYNVDGGGIVPDPHPETSVKQQASFALTRLRQRGEFRDVHGMSKAKWLNERRFERIAISAGRGARLRQRALFRVEHGMSRAAWLNQRRLQRARRQFRFTGYCRWARPTAISCAAAGTSI